MKSGFSTTALLLTATVCSAASRDDSVWINTNIATALKSGQKSYLLPAGTYVLQHPIEIPNGAKNFTLRGAGSGETLLTSPSTQLQEQIVVGSIPVLHDDWVLTNRTNYSLFPIKEGAAYVNLATATTAVVPNHYYVIWDSHVEWANNAKVTCVMNHAEIVKVVAVHGTQLTLDAPASRAYDSTAKLCDVNSIMCQNIAITGIGFNGAVTNSSNPAQSFVQAGLVDGMTVDNVEGTNFLYTALDFVNTRNVLVENATLSGAAAGGPGEGYGVTFSRCRYATASNCFANGLRHGFIFHAGTTDSSFVDCKSTGGGFDAHGMDDRRLTVTDCTSDNTLQFGNQAWGEGDADITVSGGSFAQGLNLCAYAENISVSGTALGGLNLWSELAGVTNPPPNQYPDNINLTNCALTAGHNVITDTDRIGTFTFNNCSFEATNTAWGNVMVIQAMSGTMNFENCQFQLDSVRNGDIPFQISTPNNFQLNVTNSTFTALGGGPTSTKFTSAFAGKSSMTNSLFVSDNGKNPTFLVNQSTVSIPSSTDTAKVAK
jgi:hypothetical protein